MKKLTSLIAAAALAVSIVPGGASAMDENGIGTAYYQNDFSTTEKVSEVNNDAEYQEDGTMKMSQKSLYKLGFGTQNLPNINTNKATIEIKLAFKSGPVSWMGYMFGLYDGDTTTGARVRLGYDDYNKTFTITAVKDGAGEWDESLVKSNSMSMNDWHKLCLVTDNGNYDLYLDGEKITTQSLGLNSTGLTNVTATNYMNSGDYCGVYFDDILVKETGTMALRSSSVENNAVDVDVDTEKIELTFENPLTATSTDGITIDGLTTSDYSVSIDQVNDARKAVITLNNTLEGSTAYTVNYNVNDYMGQTVSGSINFTTAASKPVQTTVSVTPENGATDVNVYSPIVFTYNKTIDEETVPTELTLSNGKKAYVNVSDNTITVQPINPKADTQSVTVTLPDTIKDSNGEDIPESTTTYTTMADSVYYEHVFRDRDNAEQTTAEFPASQYLINDPGENITGGNGLLRNDGEVVLIYKFDQGIDLVEAMEYCGAGSANVGEIKYYISDVRENLISEDNIITVSESTDETIDGKKYEKKIFNGDGKQKYFAAVVNAKNYLPQLQYLKFNQPKPDTVTADVSTVEGNSVTFKMNSRIDADTVKADNFKVEGESVLTATASGDTITLIFSSLDTDKNYTVTAIGVTDVYGNSLSELNFNTSGATETPAPEATETPAPEATEAPAPEATETPAPSATIEPMEEANEYYQNDFATAEKASEVNSDAEYQEDGTIKLSKIQAYTLKFGNKKLPKINDNKAIIEVTFAFNGEPVAPANWMGYMFGLYDGDTTTGARVRLGYDTSSKTFKVTAVKDGTNDWNGSLVESNSISPNETHKLTMLTNNGKYDLYLDGYKITTESLELNSGELTNVTGINYANNGTYCATCIDEIVVKGIEDPLPSATETPAPEATETPAPSATIEPIEGANEYYQNDFATAEKASEVNSDAEYQEDGTIKLSKIQAYTLKFGNKKLPKINDNKAIIEVTFAFNGEPVAPANWMGYMFGLYDGDTTTGARVRLGYDTSSKTFKVTAVKDGTNDWNESLVGTNSISPNEKHKLTMLTNNGKYDLYLDGYKITTESLELNSGELTNVTGINYANNGTYCATCIDEIVVKGIEDPLPSATDTPVQTTVSVTPENGATDVNVYSPIVFTYNKTIDEETVPTELTLSNGKKAYVNVSDNTITVQPINPKAYAQSVTVTLPDTIKDTNGEAIPESTTTYTTMVDSVYYEHIFRDRDNAEQTTAEFPASQYLINDPGENITGGNGLLRNDGEVVLIYKFDQGIDLIETMEYCGAGSADAGEIKYYISDVRENLISEDNIITVSESSDETIDGKKYEKKFFKGDGKQKYFAVVVNAKNYLPQLQYLKFNQPKPDTVTADVLTAEGNSVTFKMNSRIDADTVKADNFNVEGESVLTAIASGDTITLTFDSLEAGKTYTVTATNVTDVYGTQLPELKFNTPGTDTPVEDDEIRMTYENGTATILSGYNLESAVVIFAQYDSTNKTLASIETKTVKLEAGKTVDVTPDKPISAENTIKVMLWNNLENMKPLHSAIEK